MIPTLILILIGWKMEKFKVNVDSWWVQVIIRTSPSLFARDFRGRDLCWLIRQCVWAFLRCLAIGGVIALYVAMSIMAGHDIVSSFEPTFHYGWVWLLIGLASFIPTLAICLALAIAAGFIMLFHYIADKRDEAKLAREEQGLPPKQPNFLVAAYRSKKHKYCLGLELTDNEAEESKKQEQEDA